MSATFQSIMADLKRKVYHPVYFLCGEEPYYIDKITDFIANNVLEEHEREFNQTVIYGKETEIANVIEYAKQFPMMANHQVVIVKEAQNLRKIEDLQSYLENPSKSTVLVLAHKYKKPDKRKAFGKKLAKHSVYFESKKLYENKIPDWISSYLSERKYRISPKASLLVTEYLGTDLSKVANELDKLMLNLPEGTEISPKDIEENIGISKDFNTFELQGALGKKDLYKANLIAQHFALNAKEHPLVVTISSLYTYFSKILGYHFLKDRSQATVATALKVHPFFVKEYELAARNYPAKKAVAIIRYLKDFDLRSKGVNNPSTSDGELLKELVFKILH